MFSSSLNVYSDLIFIQPGGDPNNADDYLLTMVDPTAPLGLSSEDSLWKHCKADCNDNDKHNEQYPAGDFFVCKGEIDHGQHVVIPTAVRHEMLIADTTRVGRYVRWTTSYESDNIGFNVYRKIAGGDFVRVNSSMIPTQYNGSPTTYVIYDDEPNPDVSCSYKVEDVDIYGVTSFSDVFTSTPLVRGDVNGDGKVDKNDLRELTHILREQNDN